MTLEWDPNGAVPDGYRLYERLADGEYADNHHYDVGKESSCTVFGLQEGTTYHFVVRAYLDGDESSNSNEATFKCLNGVQSDDINPPVKPTAVSPVDMAIDVGLEPVLTASDFEDPDQGDTHAQTRWQIYLAGSKDCIYDVVSNTALTSLQVPLDVLEEQTVYYWTVTYYNQNGGASEPSDEADFTTSGGGDPSASLFSGGGSSSGGSSDGLGFGCFIQSLY